jgi:hypothetical protein
MSPALVQTTGVAVPMATGGVAAIVAVATVVVEAEGRVGAGNADIRQLGDLN